MHSSNLLSSENPVFKTYLFYASVLVGKMLLMSALTGRQRFRKGTFASPEDLVLKEGAAIKSDDDVERVRRAHLNDLENIPIFLISCVIYILTDPHTFIAVNLIRVFAICRILHTYVYAIHVIPQPARATVWDNPILRAFLFYASILIGKTMIMSPLTARWRFKKGVFISSEDAILRGTRVGYDDEDIERIRRAHRNDIENIPMFLVTGFIYILTDPRPFVAINLFRLYTVCRMTHTYVYAIKVHPQPIRATVWSIGYLINWYMVIVSAVRFVSL